MPSTNGKMDRMTECLQFIMSLFSAGREAQAEQTLAGSIPIKSIASTLTQSSMIIDAAASNNMVPQRQPQTRFTIRNAKSFGAMREIAKGQDPESIFISCVPCISWLPPPEQAIELRQQEFPQESWVVSHHSGSGSAYQSLSQYPCFLVAPPGPDARGYFCSQAVQLGLPSTA